MRFASLVILALPTLTLAAPALIRRDKWDQDDDHKDWKDKDHKTWNDDHKKINGIFDFTSTYIARATPDQVINNTQAAVSGEPGAYGTFKFGINAKEDVICYNIAVFISGNYSSPAKTATHIHEADFGRAGPPRLAFPNPTGESALDVQGRRTSWGCLKGPFTTGVINNATGDDTGAGFNVSQIEANPAGFFSDVHTVAFPAGAIRGQLSLVDSVY